MIWSPVAPSEIDDPFVRYAAVPDALALTSPWGWALLTQWRPRGHWGGAAMLTESGTQSPPPEAAESEAFALLTELAAARGITPEWFSTAPGRDLDIPSRLAHTGDGCWAFFWTDQVPARGAHPATSFLELDDTTDAERIERFGRAHNGSFEGFPGHGFATLWFALIEDGEMRAIGGLHELGSGAPHLAGIVVHRDHRNRGLGAHITHELTRRAIEQTGIATLGVYSSNTPAIRLYQRLGYHLGHHLHTRSVGTVENGL